MTLISRRPQSSSGVVPPAVDLLVGHTLFVSSAGLGGQYENLTDHYTTIDAAIADLQTNDDCIVVYPGSYSITVSVPVGLDSLNIFCHPGVFLEFNSPGLGATNINVDGFAVIEVSTSDWTVNSCFVDINCKDFLYTDSIVFDSCVWHLNAIGRITFAQSVIYNSSATSILNCNALEVLFMDIVYLQSISSPDTASLIINASFLDCENSWSIDNTNFSIHFFQINCKRWSFTNSLAAEQIIILGLCLEFAINVPDISCPGVAFKIEDGGTLLLSNTYVTATEECLVFDATGSATLKNVTLESSSELAAVFCDGNTNNILCECVKILNGASSFEGNAAGQLIVIVSIATNAAATFGTGNVASAGLAGEQIVNSVLIV